MHTAIGDYIRHNSGARGKVTSLSPDGTIADVYNLATGRADTMQSCCCSFHLGTSGVLTLQYRAVR